MLYPVEVWKAQSRALCWDAQVICSAFLGTVKLGLSAVIADWGLVGIAMGYWNPGECSHKNDEHSKIVIINWNNMVGMGTTRMDQTYENHMF